MKEIIGLIKEELQSAIRSKEDWEAEKTRLIKKYPPHWDIDKLILIQKALIADCKLAIETLQKL